MAKMGRPKSEEPKSNRITIRFTEEEFQKLKERAEVDDQTIAQFIREAVRDKINSYCHFLLPP